MLRKVVPLIFLLATIQTAQADQNFWKSITETMTQEAGLSDLSTYEEGMEFFDFPSFRPEELYRFYRIRDEWHALHAVFRNISNATLFESSERRGHLEVQTRVVLLGAEQLESILKLLKENAFYLFTGDESEEKGFDGETFYVQYLRDGEKVSFSYWNVGSSRKNRQMNAIAKAFRDVDYERE